MKFFIYKYTYMVYVTQIQIQESIENLILKATIIIRYCLLFIIQYENAKKK